MNSIINFLSNKKILLIIIALASILRLYQLDKVPPAISWDEAAVGYNAWTIANYGRDEYGKSFPLYFRSFGEGKNPVHIYTVALFVKFLDLTEFSIRLPMALLGIVNVLLIYFLAKKITEKNSVGLLAAFFMAISPYAIFFSRYNHELQFALFFFMSGLLAFYHSIESKKWMLPLSIILFILSMLSYNGAKIFVPLAIFSLVLIFIKELTRNRKYVLISLCVVISFVFIVTTHPETLGLERYNQTKTSDEIYMQSKVYEYTKNLQITKAVNIIGNYIYYYSYKYLFISGDTNPRLSAQSIGQFYFIDAVFLFAGLFSIRRNSSKKKIFLLVWLFFGPLPSALVSREPHAGRAMFTLGSWQIISAIGLIWVLSYVKNNLKILFAGAIVSVYLVFLSLFASHYFNVYPKKYAIEWQYGMKQAVEFVKQNPQYSQIVTTDIRFQPYIFYLFYLKTPLPDFIGGVMYNNSRNKDINNVSVFNNLYFSSENILNSPADTGILYILTPSEYDGLRDRVKFQVKKKIIFPDGSDAFFIVSAN